MFMFGNLWHNAAKAVDSAESPAEAVGIFILVAVGIGVVFWLRHKLWK